MITEFQNAIAIIEKERENPREKKR